MDQRAAEELMSDRLQAGVWGVLATPFTGSTLDVDDVGVARLVEHLEESGVAGITVLGVFGEGSRLSAEDRLIVLDTVVESTSLPLVVGCSGLSTAPVIEEARAAVEAVGDQLAGVMVLANTPNLRMLQDHLGAVHEAAGARVVLQDYPAASGVDVPEDVIAAAADAPHVVALKAEGAPTAVTVAASTARSDTPVFGGLGGINLLDELRLGAAGTMTGYSYPEALVEIVAMWHKGDTAGARQLLQQHLPLIAFEQQPKIALSIRKECLRRRGFIAESAVRPPAVSMPQSLLPALADHIDAIEGAR
jgi:4-hydroxy-tetrahydrodipicolinate synthase